MSTDGVRGCFITPRVRLVSAGSSGARTQGGGNSWQLLRRPRTPQRVDPPAPGVGGEL
jgi:hypothetical protein